MLKVLLVNDTRKQVGRLRESLIHAGCEVVEEVSRAMQIPVMVKALSPDLVIIDTESPSRDVLEQICVVSQGSPRPVVMVSNDGQVDAVKAAISAGVSAYVVEGIDEGRLAAVLTVAQARFEGSEWPADPAEFAFEWLGLVALADPLRAGVREAVQECREAGIRVLMLTGDHPVTARAIAAQAGIEGDAVHARVTPERKLELVTSLVARGEVVAMTGDGVNDAPALKAAHIGVAMGARGTDVAREAAALRAPVGARVQALPGLARLLPDAAAIAAV